MLVGWPAWKNSSPELKAVSNTSNKVVDVTTMRAFPVL